MQRINRERVTMFFDPTAEPVAEVDPGERFVVETGILPVIDGGLAGKDGGQIGAGVLRAPLDCFTAAVAAYQSAYPG